MNDLEAQLRRYATTVAGPPRHDDTEPFKVDPGPARGGRILFAVAAGVLLLVVVTAGVIAATRTHRDTAASASSEKNGLRVQLSVNTTAPGPTGQVKAKMTVTNVGGEPVSTDTLCPTNISIETIPIETPDATPPRSSPAPPPPPPEALDQWFDPMRQGTLLHAVDGTGTPYGPRCTREETTLEPGASLTIEAVATPGPLGLDRVPMNIVARAWPQGIVDPATLPFTVPSPPAGQVSRSAAIAVATARPEVQQWANQVAFGSATPTTAASTDPATASATGSFQVVPDGHGWQITITYGTHTLDVHIDADGTTGTATADGTATTF
jgi:hypothetical protein